MNGFRMLDQVVPDTTSLQQRSNYQVIIRFILVVYTNLHYGVPFTKYLKVIDKMLNLRIKLKYLNILF